MSRAATGRFAVVPIEERLRAKLVIADSGCWEFSGYRNEDGYGRINPGRSDGGALYAHRAAYELWVGRIPEGLFVCHRCDNPPCCNPAHLFVGTNADNMRDMSQKGRWRHGGGNAGPALTARGWARRKEATMAAGVPADWKRCPACATWKAPTEFARAKRCMDGLQVYCRPCHRAIRSGAKVCRHAS